MMAHQFRVNLVSPAALFSQLICGGLNRRFEITYLILDYLGKPNPPVSQSHNHSIIIVAFVTDLILNVMQRVELVDLSYCLLCCHYMLQN